MPNKLFVFGQYAKQASTCVTSILDGPWQHFPLVTKEPYLCHFTIGKTYSKTINFLDPIGVIRN